MDHKLAEASQSVEKYTLNELSEDERAQFEEHMFDCPICSDLVRQNFTVTENLKQVLREGPAVQRAAWRDWFRVPSLVPTFAALALACVIGYQDFGGSDSAQVLPQVAALKPASRGTVPVIPAGARLLPVNADQLPVGAFEFELDHSAVRGHGQKTEADAPIQILFPKPLSSGHHSLKLISDADKADSITYTFEVQESK
jgi:hypothetical protein